MAMFDYSTNAPSMNRRRHAIVPDEADYLIKILPSLNIDSSQRDASLPKHSQKHNSDADEMRESNNLDTPRFAFFTWKNPSLLTFPAIKDDPALPAHFHQDQHSDPGSSSTAPDELGRSPRSPSRVPPDNKRKYGAISDEEDDKMDVSPTAIDIVHPSELRPPEIDSSEGMRGRDRDRTQRIRPCPVKIPRSAAGHSSSITVSPRDTSIRLMLAT